MAQASLNAGLAFTNAILGATHAMSHQVGGLLDAPHGVVNGVLLPHVIRYNAAESPERFVDLARSAGLQVDGVPGVRGGRDARRARPRAGRRRRRAPGPARARRRRERVPRLALNTLDDACLTTNPRAASVRRRGEALPGGPLMPPTHR